MSVQAVSFEDKITSINTSLDKGDLLTKELKTVHKGGIKWVLIVIKNAICKIFCCSKDPWGSYRINNVVDALSDFFKSNSEKLKAPEQLKVAQEILNKLEAKAQKSKSSEVYKEAITNCRGVITAQNSNSANGTTQTSYASQTTTATSTTSQPVTTLTAPSATTTQPTDTTAQPLTTTQPVTTLTAPSAPTTQPSTSAASTSANTAVTNTTTAPAVSSATRIVEAKKGIISFANNLYDELAKSKDHQNKSFALSPLSLIAVLSMFLKAIHQDNKSAYIEKIGLKGFSEVEVHQAISTILEQSILKGDGKIQIAQGLAIRGKEVKGIHEDFTKLVKETYKAELIVSPKIIDEVNKWASSKTEGKIPTILTDEADFAFLNAIYLELAWEHKFKKAKDDKWPEQQFNFSKGVSAPVSMMTQKGNFALYEGDNFTMLEKYYKSPDGRKLAQLFFLPNNVEDLAALEKRMTPEFIEECRKGLKTIELRISLPKIKAESTLQLLEILSDKMQIPLSAIDQTMLPGQRVTKVVQKTFVENDAEGTKAAAVTVLATRKGVPVMPKTFVVDHSYAYMIMDGNNMLFRGRVCDKEPLIVDKK